MNSSMHFESVRIDCGMARIEGMLEIPPAPEGVVLFAHGSGSSRLSPRNNQVAAVLREARLATLLIDLLTPDEDRSYETRFDIGLLTSRLDAAASWLQQQEATAELPLGLFGASTGAAAALQLAALHPDKVRAVVSRGGRTDLAGAQALKTVEAPTLLIVGGLDYVVIDLNRSSFMTLQCEKRLEIVPDATHLFQEAGALDTVAALAADWFCLHLAHHERRMPPAIGRGTSAQRRSP
jgi:putative phosphoribosyl transferase